MFFLLTCCFCWQAPSLGTPAMSVHHYHSLSGPCPLPNAFRVFGSLLCSYFVAPSGMQSVGTRGPIRNLPPTAPAPLSHSLFPVHTILSSSPRKADLSVLHDLICRLLPPLPDIHPHKDWLDLQECTRLSRIVRGQLAMRIV